MSEAVIDDAMLAALDRLTDNEKECLRRRLSHQTAKQMALELGISPHAVEKRLKMARAKLGLSSSLDAARALEDWERYGRPGSQPPDLASGAALRKTWLTRPTAIGAIAMSLIAATLIVIAQQGGVAPLDAGGVAPYPSAGITPKPDAKARPVVYKDYDPADRVPATHAETAIVVRNSFSVMDEDGSGFIEAHETPIAGDGIIESEIFTRDEQGNVRATGEIRRRTADQARQDYIAMGDTNGDGKWDYEEYREWMVPNVRRNGIPAEWREDIEANY